MPDTGEHLPYADNCVALSLSKTLSRPQAQVVSDFIRDYPDLIKTWRDLEEDTNLRGVFTNAQHWTPVKLGGDKWSEIRKLCLAGHGGRQRFFAIHWGARTAEGWGAPGLTFHAICIQVKGGSLAVFGNNEEPQAKRNPEGTEKDYKQTGSQEYARNKMKDGDWVSAWRRNG